MELTNAVGSPDVPVIIAQYGFEHGQSSVLMSPLLQHITVVSEMSNRIKEHLTGTKISDRQHLSPNVFRLGNL